MSFLAGVVGVKDKPFLVESFEQNNSSARFLLTIYGSKCHCIYFMYFGRLGFNEPFAKESKGVISNCLFIKSRLLVILTYSSNICRRK